jgi:hypothetical protein
LEVRVCSIGTAQGYDNLVQQVKARNEVSGRESERHRHRLANVINGVDGMIERSLIWCFGGMYNKSWQPEASLRGEAVQELALWPLLTMAEADATRLTDNGPSNTYTIRQHAIPFKNMAGNNESGSFVCLRKCDRPSRHSNERTSA